MIILVVDDKRVACGCDVEESVDVKVTVAVVGDCRAVVDAEETAW